MPPKHVSSNENELKSNVSFTNELMAIASNSVEGINFSKDFIKRLEADTSLQPSTKPSKTRRKNMKIEGKSFKNGSKLYQIRHIYSDTIKITNFESIDISILQKAR